MPSLDDLRGIIRRIERARPARPAPAAVEQVLGGRLVETVDGPVVLVQHRYPLTHRHGRVSLAAGAGPPIENIDVLARDLDGRRDAGGLLFLDTETTGLAGGTGTYAFLVGVGYVEDEAFVVEQYFMRDLDEEPALLAALRPRLEGARAVITFNGTGFDLPLLETRYVLGRRRWPRLAHIDLLGPARRVWAPTLPDCRLTTLERDVLGVERGEDVPGGEIPSRFFAYLRHRNAVSLVPVFAHNRDDVLSLVGLLGWFARALEAAPGDLSAAEHVGLGRLWERRDTERGARYYRAALEAGLEGPLAHRVRLRLAAWEKRRAQWEAARDLWEAATRTRAFDPRPWEELAKFYEHRRHDVPAAHRLVTAALDEARAAGAASRVVDALAYRLSRLDRRLRPSGVD